MKRVVIIGAGISGLACALKLSEFGIPIEILEASDSAGGRMRTDSFEGFQLDRGFQVILSSYTEAMKLLGGLELCPIRSGAKLLTGKDTLTFENPLRNPGALFQHDFWKIFRPCDLFGVLRFLITPKPDSLANTEFERSGFSAQFLNLFLRPFFESVSLSKNPEIPSAFIRFTLLRFAFGKALVPKGGIQSIAQHLLKGLKDCPIRYSCPVERVSSGEIFLQNGEKILASHVVISTDAESAWQILGLPAGPRGRTARTFYFTAEKSPFEPRWLYLNSSGVGPVSQAICLSDLGAELSAPGQALFSIGAQADFHGDRKELLSGFAALLKTDLSGWRFLKSYEIPAALPETKAVPALPPGAFLAGDYLCAAPSIELAVRSGQSAAKAAKDSGF